MQRHRGPTLEIATPHATRHRTPADPGAPIGDIAAAAGVDPRRGVRVDGVDVDRSAPAGSTGLRRGSVLAPAHAGPARPPQPVLVAVCDAGPAVMAPVRLAPGRHVVGRGATASVRIADLDLEPHQLVLDVDAAGTATVTQIAGRVPAAVNGCVVAGTTAVAAGDRIELGSSRLTLVAPQATEAATETPARSSPAERLPGDPWRSVLVRPPRLVRHAAATVPVEPSADDRPAGGTPGRGAGVVGVVAGLVGSTVVAAVLHQPMFVLLAAVGALVSVSTWLAALAGAWRTRRAARRRRADQVDAYISALGASVAEARARHVASTPTAATVVAAPRGSRCWERRIDHGDAFVVALGWGDVPAAPWLELPVAPEADVADAVERARTLLDVPVVVDLGDRPSRWVAIAGEGADALARALVLQLAARTGPADWRLVVAASQPADAGWAGWLPHTDPDGGVPLVVDAADAAAVAAALHAGADDGRRLVVLTDRPSLVTNRTSALRQLRHDDRHGGRDQGGAGVTVILTVDEPSHVPAACDTIVEVGPRWRGRWTAAPSTGELPVRFHAAGVERGTAEATARALADLVDPEQIGGPSELPTDLRLDDLPGVPADSSAILAEWRAGGRDPRPVAPIGATATDVVEIDLVRDGPHALIAGTTGSGKSELLRTLVVALAARCSPDHLGFVLVDYKGGSTFDACTALPHTVGVVTDLDEGLAARALVSLDAELRRRERVLRDAGADDLDAYRAAPGTPPLPRLVVVVDEFAALARELPDFLRALVTVAQRGRSLGMHLVLATQRPSGVVDDHIRANTALRLALRLHDAADAVDVVGDVTPAGLPRVPGRAVGRFGGDTPVLFQAARCTSPTDADTPAASTELARLVHEIITAAAAGGYRRAHRPWIDPLPSTLDAPLGRGVVGVVDDPAGQRQLALAWDRTSNLALVGSGASGTTTALRAVIAAAADAATPAQLHVYAVDARGPAALDGLRALAHCGAVVGVHEHERLGRLLRRLDGELARRRAGATRGADVVLAVDGLAALRSTLAELDPTDGTAALDRVLADGPALGLTVVATLDPATATSGLQRFGQRWVFHLDDPGDGPALGVPTARVPPPIPGRAVVLPAGLAAQVAALEPVPGTDAVDGPAPIATLPAVVDAAELGEVADRPGALAVGRRFDDLTAAALHVGDGDRVLVVGPPRSGRSTALARLAAAWARENPDGVVVDCPADLARHRDADRLLVVLDDAERVDDEHGVLSALLGSRRPGVTVLAAARGDAVRGAYGTWLAQLRRTRCGLVMAAGDDADGDVLGASIPRRCPIRPRPGLAWIVDGRDVALVQVAVDGQLGSMP